MHFSHAAPMAWMAEEEEVDHSPTGIPVEEAAAAVDQTAQVEEKPTR